MPTRNSGFDFKYDYFDDFDLNPTINDIPERTRDKLLPFQKQGVIFGISKKGRFLLGDEMGVGKTIQGIATALVYRKEWPLLILCPSALRLNWKDEIFKWCFDIAKADVQCIKTQKEKLNVGAQIYIISYDIAAKRVKEFEDKGIKIAIGDEAHLLKAIDSKRSLALVPFLMKMRRLILMSGTPMLNRPYEIFNLLQMIRPDCFHGKFTSYTKRYCDAKKGKFGMDYTGATNLRELNYILTSHIMIRRLKKDVLTELPDKIRQKVNVDVDPKQLTQIQEYLGQGKALKNSGEDDSSAFMRIMFSKETDDKGRIILNPFMEAYKLTGQAKVHGCMEFL